MPERFAVERAAHGLRVRHHQLYLEPHGRPPLGFVAHARGAHLVLPERTVATAATVALLAAGQPRALSKAAALPAALKKSFALGSLRLTLHAAGHVLGSAQIRCEADDLDLVYSGDLGQGSLTAEPRETLNCEEGTLVLRATYGHPRYVFPPRAQAIDKVRAFIEKTLAAKATPLLVAAAIGATQDLVRALGDRYRFRLHPAALRACAVYRSQGVHLPEASALDGEGEVVIVPPTARLGRLSIGPHRTCVLSGHAVDGVKGQGEQSIALSDHLGFPDLVAVAVESGARRIFTTHTHAAALARALRDKGLDAVDVDGQHHQLPLPGF